MFSRNGRVHPKVITCYDWLDIGRVGHNVNMGDFRKELGLSKSDMLIGAVGRLEHWKGQHVFIAAAAKIAKKYPHAKFVVVGGKVIGRGREKYEDELRSLASSLRLDGKLHFAGHRANIAGVMSALDIYVHSSVEPDPLPGVVMEAMFSEKPVVGPRAGGIPEEMEEGVTGLLYKPGDPAGMALAICSLLSSPNLILKFGKAGRRRATKMFDKEKLCRHMESVYEEILNG